MIMDVGMEVVHAASMCVDEREIDGGKLLMSVRCSVAELG
jgi:hypothetical protein